MAPYLQTRPVTLIGIDKSPRAKTSNSKFDKHYETQRFFPMDKIEGQKYSERNSISLGQQQTSTFPG